MSELEWKDHAEHFLREAQGLIDFQAQLIRKDHDLGSRIFALEPILNHVSELLSANHVLQEMSQNVCMQLLKIHELLGEDQKAEIHLVAEERDILNHLSEDMAHRNWRAVKKDVKRDKRKEKRIIRLEVKHLKKLAKLFKQLAANINIEVQFASPGVQSPVAYLLHIKQLAEFYANFFESATKKEKIILDKLKSA